MRGKPESKGPFLLKGLTETAEVRREGLKHVNPLAIFIGWREVDNDK